MSKTTKREPENQVELSEDELEQVQGGATDDVYVDGNIITAENYDSAAASAGGAKVRTTIATRFKKDQVTP